MRPIIDLTTPPAITSTWGSRLQSTLAPATQFHFMANRFAIHMEGEEVFLGWWLDGSNVITLATATNFILRLPMATRALKRIRRPPATVRERDLQITISSYSFCDISANTSRREATLYSTPTDIFRLTGAATRRSF